MADRDATYEWLREVVSNIEPATARETRQLSWATAKHVLGLSRDTKRRIEVFVVGEPLTATVASVAEVLEHQTWTFEDGSRLEANRVVLPSGEHFDHFGALLCVELIDNGLHVD